MLPRHHWEQKHLGVLAQRAQLPGSFQGDGSSSLNLCPSWRVKPPSTFQLCSQMDRHTDTGVRVSWVPRHPRSKEPGEKKTPNTVCFESNIPQLKPCSFLPEMGKALAGCQLIVPTHPPCYLGCLHCTIFASGSTSGLAGTHPKLGTYTAYIISSIPPPITLQDGCWCPHFRGRC